MATMAWSDVASESNQKLPRPSLSRYVPPHQRSCKVSEQGKTDGYGVLTESTRAARSDVRQRGRGFGHQWRRRDSVRSDEPLDISEKIDEPDTVEHMNSECINFEAYEDIPVESSGSNIPPFVNSFDEIDMGEWLNENIRKCKYIKPTPIQRHALPIAFAGRDLMACAQTGSGKTAAFCIPIIAGVLKNRISLRGSVSDPPIACPAALILTPTRELSCQIYDEAKKFADKTRVKIVVAYGGAPISHQLRIMERGVDILVSTPGRLTDLINRGRVSLRMIKYLTLDEADRMLDMGFEPQIRRIIEQMDMSPPGSRQTMLFSATFPNEIQRLASDFLSNYIFLAVGRVGSSTDLIAQRVLLIPDSDKRNQLKNILHSQMAERTHGKSVMQLALTLVFVETKKGADALEQWLSINGFPAISIHGDKLQREREHALRSFKTGAVPILVATDVASRGLDISNVSHVVNYDLPKDIDIYVHRIGRTGRAGKSGLATAFFSDKNQPLAKPLVQLMQEANQQIPDWLSQLAERPFYGGGPRRFGVGKFGGYDFRRGSQSDNGNDHNHSSHSGGPIGYDYTCHQNPVSYNYYPESYTDPHPAPPYPMGNDRPTSIHVGCEYGGDYIAASGWD